MAILALNVFGLGAIAVTSYVVLYIIYNLYLHPLRKYPGPFLARATRLHAVYLAISGVQAKATLAMHRKYGDVVRVAPNELAFADARAWKDIAGHRTAGTGDLDKFWGFYRALPEELEALQIANADRFEHGIYRRMMSNGFSEKSMRAQQPIIKGYIDLLIQRLHGLCDGGNKAVDLMAWYNFTTFDVIGDLAFGESFGCLEGSGYHPWVKTIFDSIKIGTVLQSLAHWPSIKSALFRFVPQEATRKHKELTMAKTRKRVELGAERPDLIEGLITGKAEFKPSLAQIEANAGVLILAGSETTATLLSGATFLLLRNPHALTRLVDEIRSTFKSESEIDYNTVTGLPYLLACLDEALRMYPPAPVGLPRITPPEGAQICDEFIPGNTIVAVHHWAMYRLAQHFALPEEFHPERWMGDPRFANDDKTAFNPFSTGPRNCIGKNLAYIEMRVILARVLWNFDLAIADDSLDWMEKQPVYVLWHKGPLHVHLKPVVRD